MTEQNLKLNSVERIQRNLLYNLYYHIIVSCATYIIISYYHVSLFVIGFLSSWILSLVGPIKCTIIGGVFVSLGLIASSLSQHIILVVLFLGILTGMLAMGLVQAKVSLLAATEGAKIRWSNSNHFHCIVWTHIQCMYSWRIEDNFNHLMVKYGSS